MKPSVAINLLAVVALLPFCGCAESSEDAPPVPASVAANESGAQPSSVEKAEPSAGAPAQEIPGKKSDDATDGLRAELARLTTINKELAKTNDAVEEQARAASVAKAEAAGLRSQLDAATATSAADKEVIGKLRAALSEKEGELVKVKGFAESANAEVVKSKNEAAVAQVAKSSAEGEVGALRANLAKVQADLDHANANAAGVGQVREENAALKAKWESAIGELARASSDRAILAKSAVESAASFFSVSSAASAEHAKGYAVRFAIIPSSVASKVPSVADVLKGEKRTFVLPSDSQEVVELAKGAKVRFIIPFRQTGPTVAAAEGSYLAAPGEAYGFSGVRAEVKPEGVDASGAKMSVRIAFSNKTGTRTVDGVERPEITTRAFEVSSRQLGYGEIAGAICGSDDGVAIWQVIPVSTAN